MVLLVAYMFFYVSYKVWSIKDDFKKHFKF
jgi:hypothetical protein